MQKEPKIISFGEDRDSGPSGVQTFLAHFDRLGEQAGIQYEKFVFSAATQEVSPLKKKTGNSLCKPEAKQSRVWRAKEGIFLFFGYIRLLVVDIRRIRKAVASVKIDRNAILVVQEFGCEMLPIAMRIVFPTRRIVAVAHTLPGTDDSARHPLRCWMERLCYRAVSDIIFNSHSLKKEWGLKLGLPKIKGSVIWYGLPAPDTDRPVEYPSKPKGAIDFVCVARFVELKGQCQLLQAWLKVVERSDRPVRLILVGDGPTFEAMKQLAADLKVTETVIFMGARPNGAAYFEAGDVGILLSNEPEAFGLVLLEAMSRKKPVIANRIGGIPEVVEGEATGLLVEPYDQEGVVAAILKLADSAELRQRLGDAGYERWRKHFTIERMLADYGNYFRAQTEQI